MVLPSVLAENSDLPEDPVNPVRRSGASRVFAFQGAAQSCPLARNVMTHRVKTSSAKLPDAERHLLLVSCRFRRRKLPAPEDPLNQV